MPNDPTTARAALQAIADADGPVEEFGADLTQWLYRQSPRGILAFDAQPELAKALWTLDALATSMVVSGTTHFLLGMGSEAARLGDYARRVGASATERYAVAMLAELKRLNGGRLPDTSRGAVTSAIGRLEERDEAAGGEGLFLEIDGVHADAVAQEIVATLRPFVRAHVAEIVDAYVGQVEPPAPVIAPDAPHGAGGTLFSLDFRDYDARAREWTTRVASLSAADLGVVAKRYRKTVGKATRRKCMRVWNDGPRVGRTEAEWKPELRARLKLSVSVETAMTATLSSSELEPAARAKALEAYGTAAAALRHLPELERLAWGPAVIEAALAPFEGLIPRWDAAW